MRALFSLPRWLLIGVFLHVLAGALLLIDVAWWPLSLALILMTHAAIAIAGLLPRCSLLGANLVRLPTAAIRRGEIAITIDDGPNPEVTPHVLQILKMYDAKATFFCIGERAERYPELCRAIVAAGHHVENHGQRHRHHSSLFGPQQWLNEISAAQTTLHRITGRRPQFFRAVAGLRNPFLDSVLCRLDLRLATWTRRGYDTRTGNAAKVLQRLTRNLAAGDILLLHDGNAAHTQHDTAVILDVLPTLLGAIVERKLRPVTLSDALND